MKTVDIQDLPVVKRFTVGGYVAFISGYNVKVGRVVEGSSTEYAAVELTDGTEVEVTKAQCHKATPAIHSGKIFVTIADEEGFDEMEFEEDDEIGIFGGVIEYRKGMESDDDEDDLESDDEEDELVAGGVVKKKYQDLYVERSGNRDNDDMLAKRLRGADLEMVYAIAADHIEVPVEELVAKYSHLNPGMQRMCLGNRIRGGKKA